MHGGLRRVPLGAVLGLAIHTCAAYRVISVQAIAGHPKSPAPRARLLLSAGRGMADIAARPHNGARLISGFESIASQYDGFILDQFGVMHNGVVALPGAAEC